jgi:hypothetical protein
MARIQHKEQSGEEEAIRKGQMSRGVVGGWQREGQCVTWRSWFWSCGSRHAREIE